VSLLFNFFGNADPLKKNIEKFLKYYDNLVNLILLFLFYVYMLTIAWNLGYRFNFILWLVPAFSVLFYFVGVVTENTKRNYTVGIRTPWTLHSDTVWDKTHALGGKLFRGAAVLNLLGLVFPGYAIFFLLVPVLVLTIITFVYSYIAFKKLG
jgi:uncharacterized membrane protein